MIYIIVQTKVFNSGYFQQTQTLLMNLKSTLYLTGFFLFWFLSGCNHASEKKGSVSDALREKALQELRTNLKTQNQWEKVHAAEYLLWLGYPQEVQQTFEEERQKFETLTPYRICIWRVLAQAAPTPEERGIWVDKILQAFLDQNGEDLIHAAETLAKLKVSPWEADSVITQNAIDGENKVLSTYTWWASLYSSGEAHQHSRDDFFQLIHHDDARVRRIAAYALRHLDDLNAEEWYQLAEKALSESGTSEAKIYLLSAAVVTAPKDATRAEAYQTAWKELIQAKDAPGKAERAEMLAAMAEVGSLADLPLLTALLNRENPIGESNTNTSITTLINNPEDADIQSIVAYTILSIDAQQTYTLARLDWIVIAFYLLIMLGIGFVYSRKNKDEKDFLLGGGNMNPFAVGLSLFATLLSSLSYLSYPGETIKYGPVIFMGLVSFPLVYYVVGWFLIPKFMNMGVTSAYEILEIRLGLSVRMLATFFFLSLRFLWMATIIYVTVNTAILSLFDLDPNYTLVISALLMIITIIYTSMGGLKAVVATDVMQSVILLSGAIIAIIAVSVHLGSFTTWIPTQWLPQWGELKWGIDAQERLTFGNALIMVFIWQVCSAGSDQMAIQRYLATKDVQSARKTFGVSLITNFIAQLLLGTVGIAMIAFFMRNPHYLPAGNDINEQADLLFPRFILVGLPVGLSGLIVAGIFAAAMSSLSSGLNSTSSVISEDLLKRFNPKHSTSEKSLKKVKIISTLVGVFTLLLSIAVSKVEGNLYDIIVKVVNLFVTPLFVLFFLALFVSFATARGTLFGGLFSLIIAIAVAFFGFMGIEVLFITPTSLIAGIVGGVLVSYLDHKVFGNQETVAYRQNRLKNATDKKVEETHV